MYMLNVVNECPPKCVSVSLTCACLQVWWMPAFILAVGYQRAFYCHHNKKPSKKLELSDQCFKHETSRHSDVHAAVASTRPEFTDTISRGSR
jgi:hypothetical protein